MITWLKGKKTFIGITVGAIYSLLIYLNAVHNNQLVWTLIATWTGVSTRLAISKTNI
jgi:hypothetical protein